MTVQAPLESVVLTKSVEVCLLMQFFFVTL